MSFSASTISTKNELARITAKISQLKRKYPAHPSSSSSSVFDFSSTQNEKRPCSQESQNNSKVSGRQSHFPNTPSRVNAPSRHPLKEMDVRDNHSRSTVAGSSMCRPENRYKNELDSLKHQIIGSLSFETKDGLAGHKYEFAAGSPYKTLLPRQQRISDRQKENHQLNQRKSQLQSVKLKSTEKQAEAQQQGDDSLNCPTAYILKQSEKRVLEKQQGSGDSYQSEQMAFRQKLSELQSQWKTNFGHFEQFMLQQKQLNKVFECSQETTKSLKSRVEKLQDDQQNSGENSREVHSTSHQYSLINQRLESWQSRLHSSLFDIRNDISVINQKIQIQEYTQKAIQSLTSCRSCSKKKTEQSEVSQNRQGRNAKDTDLQRIDRDISEIKKHLLEFEQQYKDDIRQSTKQHEQIILTFQEQIQSEINDWTEEMEKMVSQVLVEKIDEKLLSLHHKQSDTETKLISYGILFNDLQSMVASSKAQVEEKLLKHRQEASDWMTLQQDRWESRLQQTVTGEVEQFLKSQSNRLPSAFIEKLSGIEKSIDELSSAVISGQSRIEECEQMVLSKNSCDRIKSPKPLPKDQSGKILGSSETVVQADHRDVISPESFKSQAEKSLQGACQVEAVDSRSGMAADEKLSRLLIEEAMAEQMSSKQTWGQNCPNLNVENEKDSCSQSIIHLHNLDSELVICPRSFSIVNQAPLSRQTEQSQSQCAVKAIETVPEATRKRKMSLDSKIADLHATPLHSKLSHSSQKSGVSHEGQARGKSSSDLLRQLVENSICLNFDR